MITNEELNYIAKLSRLSLSYDEIKEFSQHFNNFLAYIDTIKTANISEDTQELNIIKNISSLREDKVIDSVNTKYVMFDKDYMENSYIKILSEKGVRNEQFRK